MNMVFSMIVPAVFITLIVLIIVGVKANSEKGGEDMIKNVYIYLVLFATLMMTIGGSVGVFMAVADIVAPTPYYQSFEEFKIRVNQKDYPNQEIKEESKLSDEELRERYDDMISSETKRQVSRAKNALIKSFGWIVIPFPIFIYFQRRLSKS